MLELTGVRFTPAGWARDLPAENVAANVPEQRTIVAVAAATAVAAVAAAASSAAPGRCDGVGGPAPKETMVSERQMHVAAAAAAASTQQLEQGQDMDAASAQEQAPRAMPQTLRAGGGVAFDAQIAQPSGGSGDCQVRVRDAQTQTPEFAWFSEMLGPPAGPAEFVKFVPSRSGAVMARRPLPNVVMRLPPPGMKSSGVVEHAKTVVQGLLFRHKGLMVYKIGMTQDIARRWGMGYDTDMYTNFTVLYEFVAIACSFLETALLSHFLGCPGCHNQAAGGEGLGDPLASSSVYVVYAVLEGG